MGLNLNVYTDKPASIYAFEDNIEAFIRVISAEMLERVCQNWTSRPLYPDYISSRPKKRRIATPSTMSCVFFATF